MSKFDLLEKKFVQDSMKKSLAASTDYLLKNLPLENEVIKDCGYLAPEVWLSEFQYFVVIVLWFMWFDD